MAMIFSKKEFLWIIAVLSLLFTFTYFNLQDSIRKQRNMQRKVDVRTVADGLDSYQNDFAFFPQAKDGKIVACLPKEGPLFDETGLPLFIACEWGIDKLADVGDPNYPPYVNPLPVDPYHDRGHDYYYLSNGKDYQVFAHLEGTDEAEYDPKIEARALPCGRAVCNFGLSSDIPLDKSIEESENEISNE